MKWPSGLRFLVYGVLSFGLMFLTATTDVRAQAGGGHFAQAAASPDAAAVPEVGTTTVQLSLSFDSVGPVNKFGEVGDVGTMTIKKGAAAVTEITVSSVHVSGLQPVGEQPPKTRVTISGTLSIPGTFPDSKLGDLTVEAQGKKPTTKCKAFFFVFKPRVLAGNCTRVFDPKLGGGQQAVLAYRIDPAGQYNINLKVMNAAIELVAKILTNQPKAGAQVHAENWDGKWNQAPNAGKFADPGSYNIRLEATPQGKTASGIHAVGMSIVRLSSGTAVHE